MAGEETLRLEGFGESLRGTRSYFVAQKGGGGLDLLRGRLATLDGEVAHRGRKILVIQGAGAPPTPLLRAGWDVMFHVKDTQDLKLAVTVIQHAARPTRVVWAGTEPAAAVLSLLGRLDGVTVFGLGERAPTASDWQAIFWSPVATVEEVEPAIVPRMGAGGTTGLRSVLKELRATEVGLVWSSIGESDRRGALYWYDPTDGVAEEPLNRKEAAETLRAVAELLGKGL